MTRLDLPRRVIAVDVETTGLRSGDRVVSIGAVEVDTTRLIEGPTNLRFLHLVFDPGRTSHPRAEAVHGWNDWTLRHQDSFTEHASEIRSFLTGADLLVSHNTAFDITFINAELDRANLDRIAGPTFCTMKGSWDRQEVTSASLNNVIAHLGLNRLGKRHGALEDAWLSLCVFLWIHNHPHLGSFDQVLDTRPFNYVEPQPRPDGELPRRSRKKSAFPNSAPTNERVVEDTPRWLEAKRVFRASGVHVLCSIAMSDGELASEEIDAVSVYAQERCGELGIHLSNDEKNRLRLYVKRMRPSDEAIEKSISALAASSEVEIVRFMRAAMAVVSADGTVTSEEKDALRALYKTITGRSVG